MKQSFWSFLQLVLHLRSWYCVYGWWVVRLNAWCQYEHCLRLEIRAKLTTFIFLLISLLVFTAVFYAISHLKERDWLFKKHTLFSIHSTVFLKKFKSEKIYIVDAKKTKMDAIWSKIKCLCRVCLKMNLLLYF